MFQGKRILITGAAGFVGANLTRKMVGLGANVHILVKKDSDSWRIKDILNKVTKHEATLKNQDQLKKVAVKVKPHIIYHLAAHGCYSYQKDLGEMIETNTSGTANLLEALADIDYQCFVNTGTSSEYGFKDKPMTELDLLEPISFYAATKASSTFLGQVFAKTYHKPIATLRLFSVYGRWEASTRLIPTAILCYLRGKPIKLTSGEQKHDFIFIEDVIDAYLRAPFAKNVSGEIINIGSGEQYSNEEVVSKISHLCQTRIKIHKNSYPHRRWDTNYWVANNSKAKKLLGWCPKHTLDQGLLKTIVWFKKNLNYYE